jgi:hypothetical protein
MQLLPPNFGPLSTVFADEPVDTALSDGIVGGFAVVGYRGKSWSIRQGGQETILMRPDGDGPRHHLDLVVIAASHVIAKTWYESQWIEGSNQPPDCFSNNGVAPDPASVKKQNNLCATCRHNVIGSVITPAGKKAKACHDRKRMAVVPAGDLRNEIHGGPMLLTSPPTSLGAILQFDLRMRAASYPFYSYVTRFAFDPDESYPRFVLSVVRALTDEEALIVKEMRNDPRVERVIAETNSFDDVIEDAEVVPDATVVPLRPQQPAPADAPHSPPASAAPAQAAPAQAAPPPKKRQGRPPKAAAAAPATQAQPAPAQGAPQAAQTPQRAAPAQTANSAAFGDEVEEVVEASEEVVVEDGGDPAIKKLDAMLDNLLPQGNA